MNSPNLTTVPLPPAKGRSIGDDRAAQPLGACPGGRAPRQNWGKFEAHKWGGFNARSQQVQEALGRDPHAGDLYVFRGVRGNLIKILWHDGIGMSLYAKRLEKGRFIWPSPTAGVVGISASQLAYMLDGIDWRNPVHTFRPERAG